MPPTPPDAYLKNSSMMSLIFFTSAPTTVATFFPPLKKLSVGCKNTAREKKHQAFPQQQDEQSNIYYSALKRFPHTHTQARNPMGDY